MRLLTNFNYKHVLVLGLAKSGEAAAQLLLQSKVKVRVNDFKAAEDSAAVKTLTGLGAEVIVGSHPFSVLEGIDLIVKNPGIPYENELLQEAMKREIPIVTEIELAASLVDPEQVIGITGSNGKTTTTTLVHDILIESNQGVKLAGNIGIVASEVAPNLSVDEKLLLELSSFQLMGTRAFHPGIAVLLNLYEAHLDYHHTRDAYFEAKLNIFKNQTANDYLIYNADDAGVATFVENAQAQLIPFSTKKKLLTGAWCDEAYIYFKREAILRIKDIVLVGEHNMANILAAVAAAMLSGATKQGIKKVLTTFTGVKHRLQFVDRIADRLFYNDSKATNMLATEIALKSFESRVILLAGGLERGDDFDYLLPSLKHVKSMILFGETANRLKLLAEKAAISEVRIVEDVKEAVEIAYELSAPGDVILLSPACASWDQYKTFEERGDMFIDAVHRLA